MTTCGARLGGSDAGDGRGRSSQRRGCHGAYIDTFNPVALKVYQRQGYVPFGELADFPKGADADVPAETALLARQPPAQHRNRYARRGREADRQAAQTHVRRGKQSIPPRSRPTPANRFGENGLNVGALLQQGHDRGVMSPAATDDQSGWPLRQQV